VNHTPLSLTGLSKLKGQLRNSQHLPASLLAQEDRQHQHHPREIVFNSESMYSQHDPLPTTDHFHYMIWGEIVTCNNNYTSGM